MDAALRVFLRKGYSAATLKDISEEAGVTRGAFYWHFRDKAGIFEATVNGAYEPLNERVIEAVHSEDPPLDVLRRLFLEIVTAADGEKRLMDVIELVDTRTELTEELAGYAQRGRISSRIFSDIVSDLLREAQCRGEVRREVDTDDAAVGMLSFLSGVYAVKRSLGLPGIVRQVESFLDIYLEGLSAG